MRPRTRRDIESAPATTTAEETENAQTEATAMASTTAPPPSSAVSTRNQNVLGTPTAEETEYAPSVSARDSLDAEIVNLIAQFLIFSIWIDNTFI